MKVNYRVDNISLLRLQLHISWNNNGDCILIKLKFSYTCHMNFLINSCVRKCWEGLRELQVRPDVQRIFHSFHMGLLSTRWFTFEKRIASIRLRSAGTFWWSFVTVLETLALLRPFCLVAWSIYMTYLLLSQKSCFPYPNMFYNEF